MDPVKLLKKQHREVEALFKRIGKTEGASERRRLMEEISAKLTLHTKLEEEIFYPALREVPTKKPLRKEVTKSKKCPIETNGISARLEIRGGILRPRRSFARCQLGSSNRSTT